MRRLAQIAVVAAAVAVAGPLDARANGRFNMPTSVAQCLGVGFGPGYHAPMVLGPAWKSWSGQQRLRRIPAPLAPPIEAGFCGASSWEAYTGPEAPAGAPYAAGALPPAGAPVPVAGF
jgi:hypothetical protein